MCAAGTRVCDETGTGWGSCIDEVGPGTEDCGNALDDDCNGKVNDGCSCMAGGFEPCYSGSPSTLGVGPCAAGVHTCLPTGLGWGPCGGEVTPKPEVCGTPTDDDCDGLANEEGADCTCTPGSAEDCYSGPPGTDDSGVCKGGVRTCAADGLEWGPCVGEVIPDAEDLVSLASEDCVVNRGELLWWKELGPELDPYAIVNGSMQLWVDSAGGLTALLWFDPPYDLGFGPWTGAGEQVALVRFDDTGAPAWGFQVQMEAGFLASVALDGSSVLLHKTGFANDFYGLPLPEPAEFYAVLFGPAGAPEAIRAVHPSLGMGLSTARVARTPPGDVVVAYELGSPWGAPPYCPIGEVIGVPAAGAPWSRVISAQTAGPLCPLPHGPPQLALTADGTSHLYMECDSGCPYDFGLGTLPFAPPLATAVVAYKPGGSFYYANRYPHGAVPPGWGEITRALDAKSDGTVRVNAYWGDDVSLPSGPQLVTLDAGGAILASRPEYYRWSYAPDGDVLTFLHTSNIAGPGPVDFGGGPTPENPLGKNVFFAQYAADGSFRWSRGLAVDDNNVVHRTSPDGSVYVLARVDGDVDLGDGPMFFAQPTTILFKLAP